MNLEWLLVALGFGKWKRLGMEERLYYVQYVSDLRTEICPDFRLVCIPKLWTHLMQR